MVKKKIRYCDVCGNEMPTLLDFDDPTIIPYDIVSLGYKTKSGKLMRESFDVCQDCIEVVNELLSGSKS